MTCAAVTIILCLIGPIVAISVNEKVRNRSKRADAAAWPMFHWKDPFNIPYYFENKDLFPAYAVKNVEAAFRLWESGSCIRFHEAPGISGQPHIKITISESGVCQSSTGAKNYQAPFATNLRLTESCAELVHSIAHELGHSLGLQHTHKRFDRDEHIKLFMENVPEGFHGEFEKDDERYFNTFGVPYSFESIMHYGFYSGTRYQGLRSSCALDPLMEVQMKKSKGIGFFDYSIINKMYCKKSCFKKTALNQVHFNKNFSQTVTGKRCQNWSLNTPHIHDHQSVGDHGYCANPDNSTLGPWCYTVDPKTRFEHCFHECGDIKYEPKCEGFCHNGGYWPPVNYCDRCSCPPGYSGEFCQTAPANPYHFLSCGGKITQHGEVITSPNYPNPYPSDTFCIWWIQAPEGFYSYLVVHDFELEDCSKEAGRFDYLEVRDGICETSTDGPKFCGSELNHNLRSSGRDLVIVFSSDNQKSGKGFRFTTYFLPKNVT